MIMNLYNDLLWNSQSFEIVSWSSGTDEQIAAMVAAADEGLIDLHDYWSVGDTRTVTLSAMAADSTLGYESHKSQDVEFVLMDTTCTGFTITSTGNTPSFIVGQKDGLKSKGNMNNSDTNAGGWGACKRRTWCNDVYRMAIPPSLRSIFKQFSWKYVYSGTSSTLYTANDYFALPVEKAVFGYRDWSRTEEAALFSKWEWYNTASNRIKKQGISGSAVAWWLSSPDRGVTTSFCGVKADGGTNIDYAYRYSYGIAPFGCI